jgi:hypothetical protein
MKIIEIDPDKTNEKQVAYITDPPLSEGLFAQFTRRVRNDPNIDTEFSLEDGLLVTRRLDLDGRDLDRAEELLTETERQIQRTNDSAKTAREEFLQRISNQTGRPIRKKPPVAQAAISTGDADEK